MVAIIHCKQSWKRSYALAVTSFSTLATSTWLVYGSMLFFSNKNNCMLSNETKTLDLIMIGLMLLGFMKLILIFSLFVCYMIFTCFVRSYAERNERMNQE